MDGYNCLIDGFYRKQGLGGLIFDPCNLVRRKPEEQSFYMHLHGSPLFISQPDGNVRKLSTRVVQQYEGNASTHLVLTHFDYKQAVIVASPILKEYWKRLAEALDEVDGVTLFGYSGADKHLNKLISSKNFERIRVVEYRGGKTESVEKVAWKSRLRGEVEVVLLDSILSFSDW